MTKEEFLNLSDESQLKYLNEQAAAGKDLNTITVELKIPKEVLGPKMGFYFVGNKFMKKPMKGYGTTKRTGNELEFGTLDGKGKK